jgi:pimeloyl-ACP methyl ester carboxylesterase
MLLALAREAEKNGYILVAPIWTNQFDKGWQFKGEEHDYVTGVLRDVIRHYTVDNDRVFLFGAADGANMAFDVGLSHPDLFAGVMMMSPTNPRYLGTGMQYWKNAQKLPFYIVTGQLAGKPNGDLRSTFNEWMPKGFPALHAIYKGRGTEWFPGETPVMFDWMNRSASNGRPCA